MYLGHRTKSLLEQGIHHLFGGCTFSKKRRWRYTLSTRFLSLRLNKTFISSGRSWLNDGRFNSNTGEIWNFVVFQNH
uniref:Uncharacterized protein n=1 Tax=Ciona intestinalis TaxID=7719 RepID=H2XZ18_CIOIN